MITEAPIVETSRRDVPRRMNAELFGVCVRRSAEVVKRRIRSRFIDRKHVEGGPGVEYLIDREALAKFNVTPEVAAERLAAWKAAAQSPVQTLALAPAPSLA